LEVVWGWQKRVLESGMGQKLISKSLWVLQDVTKQFYAIWVHFGAVDLPAVSVLMIMIYMRN